MTLRELAPGTRFILRRTGQVFLLVSWLRKSHARVRQYNGQYSTLNHQCGVEPLIGDHHG